MRHVPITLVALLPFATVVSAQTLAPSNPTHPAVIAETLVLQATPDTVVARVMSFDRNNDGLVAKDELPDRMRNLITGDASGDGALDVGEIRAMVAVPRPVTATGGGFRGGYTFGDQSELSSRSRVLGAFDDLRLQDSIRDDALPLVTRFMDLFEIHATTVLLKEMEGLVTTSQLAMLATGVDRQFEARPSPDLSSMIRLFNLPPLQHGLAMDALKTFKARLRFGDAQRTALVDELKGTLTDEDRDNFRAALERRPLVKATSVTKSFTFSSSVVVPNGVVKDGVFVMPITPESRVLTP
jgi:hypothetical protein